MKSRIEPLIGDELLSYEKFSFKDKLLRDYLDKLNGAFEYALRHLVDPPIEGTITTEEIRKRGIRLECTEPTVIFGKNQGYVKWEAHIWQGDKMII